MNKCELCNFNGGIKDNKVYCGNEGKTIPITTDVCAAQELTIHGWVHATNEAENIRGDFYAGELCRNRIIALKHK